MFLKLLLLFILVPWLEIVVLLRVGHTIGLGGTIAVILLTGVLGAALARQQGLLAVRRIKETLQAGQLPARELLDGVLILVAGLVLLTPGLITDSIGFLLLIEPARKIIRERLLKHLKKNITFVGAAGAAPPPSARPSRPAEEDVIDVEAKPVEDDPSGQLPPSPNSRAETP